MAIRDTPTTFDVDDFTVGDLIEIADRLRTGDVPRNTKVRVLTRPGFSRHGSDVRRVNLLPAPAAPRGE